MTKRRKKRSARGQSAGEGIAVMPSDYEPTPEEMEEVIKIDATPDELADMVVGSDRPIERDDAPR